MEPKTKPVSRTPNCRQGANLADFLAQLRSSRSIHFVKALCTTALRHPGVGQTAKLHIPSAFVEDHAEKIEEVGTLRVRTSRGRSSTSWRVRFTVLVKPTVTVSIIGGWPAFVADNGLQLGDFVVFVLREDAKSEFEVLLFRGPRALPYFPDQGELESHEDEGGDDVSSDSEEEQTDNPSRLVSPVHQQEEQNQAFRRDTREENPAPLQHTGNPRAPPRFSKRLKASHIGGPSGEPAQFEFPIGFIRAHGEQVHGTVNMQGIHEYSQKYVLRCKRRPQDLCRVYLASPDWSRFVQDNDLKEGEELQFSLMADSYFLIRRIS